MNVHDEHDFVHRLTSKAGTIGCILFDQSKSVNFAIQNWVFRSIKSLNFNELQSERSIFYLTKLLFDRRSCSFIDKHGGSRLVQAKIISIFSFAKGL